MCLRAQRGVGDAPGGGTAKLAVVVSLHLTKTLGKPLFRRLFSGHGILNARVEGANKGVTVRILLVEDDQAIVEALGQLLEGQGYEVRTESGQDSAIAVLRRERFDLLLLDITLAQGSGFAVCMAAKEVSPGTPIIFLTASDDEFSTVAGLEMGAMDYIAKPFRPRELLSRIRVALRTSQGGEGQLRAGAIVLDPHSATVTKNGAEVFLSALEYRLLLYLLQNKGRLVTREALRDALWDAAGEYVSDNSINVYMRRLREKIEENPSEPAIVMTVRGLGYKVCE